jgi:hypothetical protein
MRPVVPSLRLTDRLLLWVALGGLAACADEGSSSAAPAAEGSADCADLLTGLSFPAGCGAAPNGAWEIARYCPFPEGYDPLGGTCASASYAATGGAVGVMELRDNGLLSFDYEQRLLTLDSRIPTSCYGDGEFCRGSALGGDCSVTGATCGCSEQRIELGVVEQGQWSATDGSLRFDYASGLAVEQLYCVDGTSTWLVLERPAALGLPGVRMLFHRR